jgi:hypothetical protein
MDRVPCEFFLIRYVPDVVKGEFTNIGVVLREAAGAGGAGRVQFTRDWSRVRCMDAEADVGLLEGLEGESAARLAAGVSLADPKAVMEVLEDTLSNSVQMSPVGACLAENMTTEMELLMKLYVEPLKVVKTKVKTGRGAIAGAMRAEFERAAVWKSMRKRISASLYTRAGDPMKIDCGYRGLLAGSGVRMFQAVSLDGDVEGAKGLAYSAAALREGVVRVEGVELELTAVVEPLREITDMEDEADERWERYRFGVQTMEREAIRVVTVNDLARAAQTAKVELRM